MEIHVLISTVWQDSWVSDSEVTVHMFGDLGTDQWQDLDLYWLSRFCSFQADAPLCWRSFTIWLSQWGVCTAWSNQKKCWRKGCVLSWHLRGALALLILPVCLHTWSCCWRKISNLFFPKIKFNFYFQVREETGIGTWRVSSVLVCAAFPSLPLIIW